jgi:hypothetical protein
VEWEYPGGKPTQAKMKELNIEALFPSKTE